jgi:hypothetical protein
MGNLDNSKASVLHWVRQMLYREDATRSQFQLVPGMNESIPVRVPVVSWKNLEGFQGLASAKLFLVIVICRGWSLYSESIQYQSESTSS